MITAVLLITLLVKVNSLNMIQKLDELEEQLNIPDDEIKTVTMEKSVLDKRSGNNMVESGEPIEKEEVIVTAESNNLVYQPLYVYRRIEHSKRRINMFNAFAG